MTAVNVILALDRTYSLSLCLYWADWEYGEGGEAEEAVESDSDDNAGPRQLPESEYDFYRLSNLDFDMMTRKCLSLLLPTLAVYQNSEK